ncbi:bacteriophage abortive infection AbiH family protein [Pseudomonas alliivorans]|nr:bacteriophage abortive infection AbiH family protein [Pseudomonas alliivorans]MEE5146554.1 bacteriophage abortive infection AbiH family protein [Pseudomonas alliivorans]
MNAKTLYIIGNGFDRHHRMPTGYGDFKTYLAQVDDETYDWVERYVPAEGSWADLEQALADLDTDNIVSDMECFLGSYSSDDWSDSGHHDFQYEVDRVATGLSETLQQRFAEWIRSIALPERSEVSDLRVRLEADAIFLNFNYTSTLTHLYDVPTQNILHIHGEALDPTSVIVLGHARDEDDRTSLLDSADPESDDHRLLEAYSTLDDYFSRTFKPSEKIIQDNAGFFENLSGIEKVTVLGHSMSEVDDAYFSKLIETFGDCPPRWTFALPPFDDGQRELRKNVSRLAVDNDRIEFKTWDQL